MNQSAITMSALDGGVHRRTFLADMGMGFTGLALGAMLARDGIVRADACPTGSPPTASRTSRPRPRASIWLFMNGGVSQARVVRPEAGAHEVRRQVDRRDAVQGRAESREAEAGPRHRRQRRQRPAAQQALSAAGRLPEVRPERASS